MSQHSATVGIDLFSGAGGMTLGAREAGIEVVYAVENCPVAASTYRLNFPSVPLFVGNIQDLRALPRTPAGQSTVLFGGPPCQGFSTSNQRTRNAQNPHNWMYKEFLRIAKMWRPEWIVMENVKGIMETAGGLFLARIVEALENVGYTTSVAVLNASGFGVPQRRARTFIVGSRSGHSLPGLPETKRPAPTVGMALSDLPSLKSGASVDSLPYRHRAQNDYAKSLRGDLEHVTGNLVTKNASHVLKRYPYVPQGGNWENIPPSMLGTYKDATNCHTGIYRRLHPNRPSVVIGNFRKNMLIHPTEHRGLSVREAARIQAVPDHFLFSGSIGFQQQQVGNMVPPPLAQAVMEAMVST